MIRTAEASIGVAQTQQSALRRPHERAATRLSVIPGPRAQHRLARAQHRHVEQVAVPAQPAVVEALEILEAPPERRIAPFQQRQIVT